MLVVDRCLKFGHFGVIEHPQITFNCTGFPHSVIQQARTHRVGISFDVQSLRYVDFSNVNLSNLHEKFYFRPVGYYGKYYYSVEQQAEDITNTLMACDLYTHKVDQGMALEHARDLLPFNVKQNFVVSFNARSLLHFLDLRLKNDAQLEIRTLAGMLSDRMLFWMPEVAEFYLDKHHKRLAP
jgi:thymidylate synthase (FAD)